MCVERSGDSKAHGKCRVGIDSRRAKLAGAECGSKLQISLEAAAHLHGGVARADDALALAPGSQGRKLFPEQSVQPFDDGVVGAHKAQSATMRLKIGSQIV